MMSFIPKKRFAVIITLSRFLVLMGLLYYGYVSISLAQCDEILSQIAREYDNQNHIRVVTLSQTMVESQYCTMEQEEMAFAFQGASYYSLNDLPQAETCFYECLKLNRDFNCPVNIETEARRFFDRVKAKLWVSLVITSEPSGATVFFDGDSGITPYRKDSVFAGESYVVRLTMTCYKKITSHITIEKGEPNLKYYRMERALCPIQIASFPSGAKVLLDGRDIGTTTLIDSVSCGEKHRLYLNKSGYCDTVFDILCLDEKELDTLVYLHLPKSGPSIISPIIATSLAAVAGGFALYFDNKADGSYDKYMNSIQLYDINKNYDQHKKDANWRDASLITGGSLGAISLFMWVRYFWMEGGKERCSVESMPGHPKNIEVGLVPKNGHLQLIITKKF